MAMTSRERMLAAIRSEGVDHVPLMIRFWQRPRHARAAWQNERERLGFHAARGWDASVELWCGIQPAPEVEVEVRPDGMALLGPILHQVWHTPAGDISERLRITDDWAEAQTTTDGVWLLHDFRTSRYLEVPFKTEQDLDALEWLFPIEVRDEVAMGRNVADARALADEFGVPLCVDIRSGLDWLVWLYPAQEAVLRTLDAPEFIRQMMARINAAHRRRLELYVQFGVDCTIRSGWYESAALWSPELFREYAMPQLEWEIALAAAAGVAVVYLMDSGVGPLLPELNALGFDCLAGVDPATAGGVAIEGCGPVNVEADGTTARGEIEGPARTVRITLPRKLAAGRTLFVDGKRAAKLTGPTVDIAVETGEHVFEVK